MRLAAPVFGEPFDWTVKGPHCSQVLPTVWVPPEWPATGTFAHRNHRRPTWIATPFPRLLGLDGRNLRVTDLDAVDGTPIIDFVPVIQEMLPHGPVPQPSSIRPAGPPHVA